jgi:predicted transcriptional regulator
MDGTRQLQQPSSRRETGGAMSSKKAVIEAVRKISDRATLQEISDEIALLMALQRSQEAVEAGDVIPHDEVKRKLASWKPSTKSSGRGRR